MHVLYAVHILWVSNTVLKCMVWDMKSFYIANVYVSLLLPGWQLVQLYVYADWVNIYLSAVFPERKLSFTCTMATLLKCLLTVKVVLYCRVYVNDQCTQTATVTSCWCLAKWDTASWFPATMLFLCIAHIILHLVCIHMLIMCMVFYRVTVFFNSVI